MRSVEENTAHRNGSARAVVVVESAADREKRKREEERKRKEEERKRKVCINFTGYLSQKPQRTKRGGKKMSAARLSRQGVCVVARYRSCS
jgi:hypothetical protein